MESDSNPSLFWLGIEAESDDAAWLALVRERLDGRGHEAPPPRPEKRSAPRAKVRSEIAELALV
ncbi:hypothetical protein Q4F19_02210 [Sphingomonas sp. BIUV-7]|uniref:PH domain-containing protein n=1 Tax=Sphingomonas natans TaxID=3063330 RepID=A0ABT8Y4D8_9SPHN|nr:hypothetical protein [Sphingomonas sp. BIUV-7]MDO6413186.1 hypothetical protein [Sphingomonas sp. BIUV-7]